MAQRTPKKNKLEKGLEKPKVSLIPLEKTAVHTRTKKKYDTLMRVYECGGWGWYHGSLPQYSRLPTQDGQWQVFKKETCVDAKNGFGYCNKEFYRREGEKIISTKKFYDIQKITPEMLKEINNYFETITKK